MGKNHLERILYIDRLLRQERYPSRKDIASQFEVSIKTVERDIEYMRSRLGAPVLYSAGRRGYFYSEKGFYLPSLYMKEGEAFALFLAQKLGSACRGTPMAELASHAWEQLSQILPKEIEITPALFSEKVFLSDTSVPFQSEYWMTLLKAATACRKAEIEYTAPGYQNSVPRLIHPYRLIFNRQAWYLLGFDEYHQDIRTFAISRISSVRLFEQIFLLPDGFDPSSYIDPAFGVSQSEKWFNVVLQADTWMTDILVEHLSATKFIRTTIADGQEQLEFQTNQHEELKHWILQWGQYVTVKAPFLLQKELAEIGNFYRDQYGYFE